MFFSTENKIYLKSQIEKLGYKINDKHLLLMDVFYDELLKYNEHTNLTRITEEKDFIEKHILDSLSCIKALDNKNNSTVKAIDIGTGAGFPLVPLWFFFPEWKITLVDSVKKKLNFISHFFEILKQNHQVDISNIEIIHSRAEDLSKDKKYREKYDYVFLRAVSQLNSIVELSMPFLDINGFMIAMKSITVDDEISASKKIIDTIGGKLINVDKFKLLDTDMERALVKIKKIKKTPESFPRKTGLAQKSPII